MTSILQEYLDVTQSFAFKSSQISSSPSVKGQNQNTQNKHQFKCFNCYGISNKQEYCPHCSDTDYISDTHPLAILFNDIFNTKFCDKTQQKQNQWNNFQDVQTIRQQQEQVDERKIICDICNKQCDINYKYYCQCCQCFYVCLNCAQQKGDQIDHQHPLATNKKLYNNLSNNPLLNNKNNKLVIAKNNKITNTNSYQQQESPVNIQIRRTNSKQESLQNQQNDNLEYFNVIDIIQEDMQNIYQNAIRNARIDQSTQNINQMLDSLNPHKFNLLNSLQFNLAQSNPPQNNMLISKKPKRTFTKQSQSIYISNLLNKNTQSINFMEPEVNHSMEGFSYKLQKSQHFYQNHHISNQFTSKQITTQIHHQKKINHLISQFNSSQVFTKSIKSHSRFFDSFGIEKRDSIDFNLYQNSQMGQSVGPRQSFGFGTQSMIQQMCSNCAYQLKDFYSVCKTCEKSKITFKICCQCEDQKSYKHDKTHQMEMVLGNLLGRRSQMISEPAIQSDEQDQQIMSLKMTKKKSSLQKRPPLLQQSPFDDHFSDKKSFCKHKTIEKYNQNEVDIQTTHVNNFCQQSHINVDCEGLYNSIQLGDCLETIQLLHKKLSQMDVNNSIENMPNSYKTNIKQQNHRVQFVKNLYDDEEKIPIQYVSSQQNSSQSEDHINHHNMKTNNKQKEKRLPQRQIKSLNCISQTQDKSPSFSSRQITSSIKYNRNSLRFTSKNLSRQYQSNIMEQVPKIQQFIFHQYSCDQCGCHPIKNVRYHCLECEDYDVCQNCFNQELQLRHNHEFQKIDGLQKILNRKSMQFQRKDLNKGRDNMLRSSNIGMLAKTKKTVQLVKKSVNILNNTVTGISKSIGSYRQTMSQRLSFNNKVQYF